MSSWTLSDDVTLQTWWRHVPLNSSEHLRARQRPGPRVLGGQLTVAPRDLVGVVQKFRFTRGQYDVTLGLRSLEGGREDKKKIYWQRQQGNLLLPIKVDTFMC